MKLKCWYSEFLVLSLVDVLLGDPNRFLALCVGVFANSSEVPSKNPAEENAIHQDPAFAERKSERASEILCIRDVSVGTTSCDLYANDAGGTGRWCGAIFAYCLRNYPVRMILVERKMALKRSFASVCLEDSNPIAVLSSRIMMMTGGYVTPINQFRASTHSLAKLPMQITQKVFFLSP